MAEKSPPTYEELAALRAQEWDAAQAKAAAAMQAFQEQILASPDVRHAPAPDVPWSSAGIVCPCGGEMFLVPRYVTVNGLRHRAELKCLSCDRVDTWDFGEHRWLPWA